MKIALTPVLIMLSGCGAYHNPKDVAQIKMLQANLDAANVRAENAEAKAETTRYMLAAQTEAAQRASFAQERQADAAEDSADAQRRAADAAEDQATTAALNSH